MASLATMVPRALIACLLSMLASAPNAAHGYSCNLAFTIDVTQGVPAYPTGAMLEGWASFTTLGDRFRQEGGATAHLAAGEMGLGDEISGPIWALIVTSRGGAADLIGVHANNVRGLTVAGVEFGGPMVLTLYGRPGTQPEPSPPTKQEDWDRLNLRRSFSLQAPEGRDMLAGDVLDLSVDCE